MAKKTAFGRPAPAFDKATAFDFGANRKPRPPRPGGKPGKGRKGPAGGGS